MSAAASDTLPPSRLLLFGGWRKCPQARAARAAALRPQRDGQGRLGWCRTTRNSPQLIPREQPLLGPSAGLRRHCAESVSSSLQFGGKRVRRLLFPLREGSREAPRRRGSPGSCADRGGVRSAGRGRAQAAAERAPSRQGRARGDVRALNLLTQGSWGGAALLPHFPRRSRLTSPRAPSRALPAAARRGRAAPRPGEIQRHPRERSTEKSRNPVAGGATWRASGEEPTCRHLLSSGEPWLPVPSGARAEAPVLV